MASPRPLKIEAHESWVEFTSQGMRWRFDRSVESVLQTLKDGQVYSIRELCRVSGERLDRLAVRTFLGELVVKGLAVIVEDRPPCAS